MPTAELASWGLALSPSWCSVDALAAELRRGRPAILARTRDDALVLDLRTLEASELESIRERLELIAPPRAHASPDVESDPAQAN